MVVGLDEIAGQLSGCGVERHEPVRATPTIGSAVSDGVGQEVEVMVSSWWLFAVH